MMFLCLQIREVIVTESTEHPNSTWVCEQTMKFIKTLQQSGIKTNPLPIVSPNLNGRCERFIETIKLECLEKFIILGKQHLDYLISEFTIYYNMRRSHTARDHLPPIRKFPEEVEKLSLDEVQVISHIDGLVKSFERKVA